MASKHTTGVYEIRNTVNGKRYVGSAVSFHARWGKHQSELRRGVHHSRHLQSAWNKYGPASFEFLPLLVCSRDNLLVYEQIALDHYRPAYNVRIKADSALGVKRSQESIDRFRATRAAGCGWSPSDETRAKISATLKGRPGHPLAEKTKALLSAMKRGILTPQLAALRDAKVGVPRTADVREKLSKAQGRLTADDVLSIRARAKAGVSQKCLAAEYNLAGSCVSEIVRGVTYTWVE